MNRRIEKRRGGRGGEAGERERGRERRRGRRGEQEVTLPVTISSCRVAVESEWCIRGDVGKLCACTGDIGGEVEEESSVALCVS